ncbi:putative membrane protein YkoI [Oxalobacteraceae bacterium GrIS 1.11]
MLISFKSKSSPEVLMYQEHAQRILDLLHKSPTRGVITSAEAANALATLEKEVAESRLHPEIDIEHDVHTPEKEDDESIEHAEAQHVGFSARAFPLLEMLRSAKENGENIIWGI